MREAVHILVTKGLLISRRKLGTLVRSMDQTAISEPLSILLQSKGFTLEDLHEVRSLLEVEIAGLAAERASAENVEQLAAIVNVMESFRSDPVRYAESDAEFHHCLASASGNALLIMLLNSVASLLKEVRLSLSSAPELFVSALADHRRILEAVSSRSSSKARQAMRLHLQHARHIQEKFLQL